MTVLSFHPIFEGARNILCAGREPTEEDRTAIRSSRAVILPQGCSAALYRMARNNCRFVFPNYDARFQYPGKIGQSRLFKQCEAPHPETESFDYTDEFASRYGHDGHKLTRSFPFVFKFNWGGEGDTVFLLKSPGELEKTLQLARDYERTGQLGFLIQELVPSGNRVLRVVVIGAQLVSYWRTGRPAGPFTVNLAGGGAIDRHSDPHLITTAEKATRRFCRRTGINLAGFDILFPSSSPDEVPLLLEINYFFGRRGLGGSEAYYPLLTTEIERWLASIGIGQ